MNEREQLKQPVEDFVRKHFGNELRERIDDLADDLTDDERTEVMDYITENDRIEACKAEEIDNISEEVWSRVESALEDEFGQCVAHLAENIIEEAQETIKARKEDDENE